MLSKNNILANLYSNLSESNHNKSEFEKRLVNERESDKSLQNKYDYRIKKASFETLNKINLSKLLFKKAVRATKDIKDYKEFTNLLSQNRIEKYESKSSYWNNKFKELNKHENLTLNEDVILSLKNVSINFGGLKALDNLSFDVKAGEIFGLIGPNGAGKTTLFNCITQFYKANHGEILFQGEKNKIINLNNYQVHDIINKGIVRTFQNLELVRDLSVIDNILIAAHRQYTTGIANHLFNSKRLKLEEIFLIHKAEKILDSLGLKHLKDLPPIGLPYGVLKRIELARTLMADAKLIILDEPAAGLNDEETSELEHLIKKINKEYNVTIFLVEHDMGLVMNICDHICTISFGKKIAFGTPVEIQNNKEVQVAYLGSEVD
jgi:branched-chain amino acid transport system ATP-binding protein